MDSKEVMEVVEYPGFNIRIDAIYPTSGVMFQCNGRYPTFSLACFWHVVLSYGRKANERTQIPLSGDYRSIRTATGPLNTEPKDRRLSIQEMKCALRSSTRVPAKKPVKINNDSEEWTVAATLRSDEKEKRFLEVLGTAGERL